MSELKSTLKEQLSVSSRRSEDMEMLKWRCLHNKNGVRNTLWTTKYSFFLLREEFVCFKSLISRPAALASLGLNSKMNPVQKYK